MKKRAFLTYRPVFWPKFFVANIKLVLFGRNLNKHYGLPNYRWTTRSSV